MIMRAFKFHARYELIAKETSSSSFIEHIWFINCLVLTGRSGKPMAD